MYLDQAINYRNLDVTNLVKQARQQGKNEIAFCIGGDTKKKGGCLCLQFKKHTIYAAADDRGCAGRIVISTQEPS